MNQEQVEIEPAILYFGTPVVLISSLNEDGTTNIAPNSSAWWLGWSCMLGIDGSSQTTKNLLRHGECVLNLAGVEMAMAVFDRLAAARQEMTRRATAQAFDRMFEQIMEIFLGSTRNQNP